MGLTRELLDFERAVVELKAKLESHTRYIYRELEFGEETDTVTFDQYLEMLSRVEDEVERMKTYVSNAAGDLLLLAVEVSKRVIDVENQHLKEQV